MARTGTQVSERTDFQTGRAGWRPRTPRSKRTLARDIAACIIEKRAKGRDDYTEPEHYTSDPDTLTLIRRTLAEHQVHAEVVRDSQQAQAGEDAPLTPTGEDFDLF
jgi:hypothetical protein